MQSKPMMINSFAITLTIALISSLSSPLSAGVSLSLCFLESPNSNNPICNQELTVSSEAETYLLTGVCSSDFDFELVLDLMVEGQQAAVGRLSDQSDDSQGCIDDTVHYSINSIDIRNLISNSGYSLQDDGFYLRVAYLSGDPVEGFVIWDFATLALSISAQPPHSGCPYDSTSLPIDSVGDLLAIDGQNPHWPTDWPAERQANRMNESYELCSDLDLSGLQGFKGIGSAIDQVPSEPSAQLVTYNHVYWNLDSSDDQLYESFSGSFKGNGFRIRGLQIHEPQQTECGLFRSLVSAQIVGLNLEDFEIHCKANVGALAGHAVQAVTQARPIFIGDIRLNNSVVSATEANLGGIIGVVQGGPQMTAAYQDLPLEQQLNLVFDSRDQHSEFQNIRIRNTIVQSSDAYSVGGGFGEFSGSLLNKFNASQTFVQSEGYNVGGIVGFARMSALNEVQFEGAPDAYPRIEGALGTGGIVGNAFQDVDIVRGLMTAEVKAQWSVGGAVGSATQDLQVHELAVGQEDLELKLSALEQLGGLVGRGDVHIFNSRVRSTELDAELEVGGLVGQVMPFYESYAGYTNPVARETLSRLLSHPVIIQGSYFEGGVSDVVQSFGPIFGNAVSTGPFGFAQLASSVSETSRWMSSVAQDQATQNWMRFIVEGADDEIRSLRQSVFRASRSEEEFLSAEAWTHLEERVWTLQPNEYPELQWLRNF